MSSTLQPFRTSPSVQGSLGFFIRWLRSSALAAPATGHVDLDGPRCHFSVFLFADETQLRGANVAVSREFAYLVHLGPVADRVVDGGLAERMGADATLAQPDRSI